MPAETTLPLLLGASMLLTAFPFFSQATIYFVQVELTNGERSDWPVDGVATVEIGQDRSFAFDCGLSNVPSECEPVWGKTDFTTVNQHIVSPQIVQLDFDEAAPESLGKYVCVTSGCNTNEEAFLVVTEANPAVLPVQEDRLVTASVGDNVTVAFKVSSLPQTQPSNINWSHENGAIPSGTFSEDKRSLMIDNVQSSDAGQYQIQVCVALQCEAQHTNLSVVGSFMTTTKQISMPTISPFSTPLLVNPSMSSSTAAKDISQTPVVTISSSHQLPSPVSSTTMVLTPSTTVAPIPTTTIVPAPSTTSVPPLSNTTIPSIQQSSLVVTPSSFPVTDKESCSREHPLVIAAVVLLALILVVLVATDILILVRICTILRNRKSSGCTDREHVGQEWNSKNFST